MYQNKINVSLQSNKFQMRDLKLVPTYEVDFTKPVNKENFIMADTDCFGKEWDMSSKECPQCADRDICGLIYKDVVDSKAKQIEQDLGSKFLDEADFDNMTTEKLLDFIQSGVTTTSDLIEEGMRLSNCSDVVAVKTRLTDWIRNEDNIRTRGGIVWVD